MANKYLALQKEVFDINKVTVVGNPTITNDGVASGFSASDYLQGATGITLGNNFKIQAEFTTDDDVTSYQGILRMQSSTGFLCSISNRNNSSRLVLSLQNTGDVGVIPVMKTNTKYEILIECQNGLLTTYYSENNSNLTKVSEVENVNITEDNTLFQLGNNTANVYWRGSINLKDFKIYVDNQLVFQPVKPTYLLERRKPKVWNKGQFTIVGNPSISDSGVASGFTSGSTGNHIEGIVVPQPVSSYEEHITFSIGNIFNHTVLQQIRSARDIDGAGIRLYINTSGYLCIRFGVNDNGTPRWANDSNTGLLLQTNTSYNIKITWDGTQYKVFNNDNLLTTISSSYPLYPVKLTLGNGYHSSWNYPFTEGSIDLKQFKIYTDNNLVFDGGADTYVYDPSKFTIVGSPTITEYGVASGFSSEDYVTTKNSIDFSNANSWEILTPIFKHSTDLIFLSAVLSGSRTEALDGIAIFMRPSGKTCWLVQDVQGGSFIFKRDANTTFTDGALNQFKMEFTGNAYNFYHSVNGGAFALVDTFASTTKTTVNTLLYLGVGIGIYYRGDYYALPSTSITIDGKEVFTGAKENYYMLRR